MWGMLLGRDAFTLGVCIQFLIRLIPLHDMYTRLILFQNHPLLLLLKYTILPRSSRPNTNPRSHFVLIFVAITGNKFVLASPLLSHPALDTVYFIHANTFNEIRHGYRRRNLCTLSWRIELMIQPITIPLYYTAKYKYIFSRQIFMK